MADFNDGNDDMNGTQGPLEEPENTQDDGMTGTQVPPEEDDDLHDHDMTETQVPPEEDENLHDDDDQLGDDAEELAAMELEHYQKDQQDDIIDSIEDGNDTQVQDHEVFEPHLAEDAGMHDVPDLPQEYSEAPAFYDNDPTSLFIPERESSSLFIPERESIPSSPVLTARPSTNMPPPTLPPLPRQKLAGNSTLAKIRSLQKQVQERKIAASRKTPIYPGNVNPDNEEYLAAVLPTRSQSTSAFATSRGGPTAEEEEQAEEEANKKAVLEYNGKKRYYNELKKKQGGVLHFRQDVEWMKIQGAEVARKQKRARDLAKAQEVQEGEPGEDCPAVNNEEEEESGDASHFGNTSSRKRRHREMPRKATKQTSMQDAELQSMRVALEADEDVPRKKKKGAPKDGESQASAGSSRGRGSKAKSTSRPKAASKKAVKSGAGRGAAKNKKLVEHAFKQATSLFNADVFQQQAGANAIEQPTFSSRNKTTALKELIASVPLGDQGKAKGDMNILLAATKDFDGRGAVKSDGKGFWIVKGMKTSLKAYQILGAAFMRRRENAAEEPRGGLMADQMGLGKTLMMLANVVNGQPPKGAKGPKTTLLIASPALLTQWKNEIEQHTDNRLKLKIMRYGSGTRIDSSNASNMLQDHDIILTTYTEIMKSYPKNEPPIACQTAEQKIQWWKTVYENQRGVLHRMMFLRVVLDEAQAIKNHTARTSIACRALMAHHKWALSGTPILNSLTELYPYFKFLNVPHTGSFKIFKHNYCDSGDPDNTERLLLRLSQFMIRRTHADEMFGAPILKLPQADQSTYWCEFNSVERCIYDIVHQRFAKNINMWQQKGELEKSYSNALVMLLRLRQLTAHVLMLQFVMQDLLEREDIERIKEVVKGEAADSFSRRGKTIIAIRKQLEKLAEDDKKKRATRDAKKAAAKANGEVYKDGSDDDNLTDEEQDGAAEEDLEQEGETQSETNRLNSGGQFGKEFNFKPFLSSLNVGESWEKAKKKAKCGYCGKQPYKPWITSCGHLICEEPCRSNLDIEAAENDSPHPPCKVCGITPSAIHPCEVDEDDPLEAVAQGTRSRSKKKKEKERKRLSREDINSDWLGSLGDDVLPSAKTIAVKSQIMNWLKENPNVKIIVYTQFLAMIKILARICQKEGWQTEQYHGKLSFAARDKAISNFAENPGSGIMLASLRCGGLGLNLTMASKVIMIDPWWNSASEQQAFCRVFRIGQKEETFMSRLCVKNTVDERLIKMQERKQQEIDAVMEDDGSKTKKLDIRDLMRLFGNLQDDEDGKPFIMVDNPDPRGGFRADGDDEGYVDDF